MFLSSQNLADKLISECVTFLNFRASAVSGRAFDPESSDFEMLSPGLKEDIQHALYRPMLERVHFFGHNPGDKLENLRCQKEFELIDMDHSGSLVR